MENKIQEILFEKISEQNVYFVFPTQISCDRWADYAVINSKTKAVSMERFIPWDDFKGSAIRSTRKDKTSVPSVMRRFFASDLLSQNARKPFLKEIVSPAYASSSGGFVNWVSGIIPALSMWKKFFDNSGKTPDAEDEDFLEIYRRYQAFLDKYNLFDPAWETPPFNNDGKKYILFYPEILSDWFEYEAILRSSPDITIVNLEASKKSSPVFTFPDSRSEIKAAVRYLRYVHEKEKLPWDEIALSVPDMESYGPYVTRELELFEIPYVSKYARPLSSFAAGSLFADIRELYSGNFSYESLKKLLLNLELPWKEREAIDQLLEFGRNNNCIINITDEGKTLDVWEKSFAEKRFEERARTLYSMLKKSVTNLVLSKNFSELRSHYFSFREDFFDMKQCSEKTDKILGRILTELSSLIELEKTFSECQVSSPFSFFISCLDEKSYLSQSEKRGVQVLPYKLSGTAPFSLQMVLDASQTSMSVIYRALSFLREDKRKEILNVEDVNAGDAFIALYQNNSLSKNAWFSVSAKTFTGYSQPVSILEEVNFDSVSSPAAGLSEDFYKAEKLWYQEEGDFPERITRHSKDAYENWRKNSCLEGKGRASESFEAGSGAGEESPSGGEASQCEAAELKNSALSLINEKARRVTENGGKVRVSYSQLKLFLTCPQKYYLHSIMKLKALENEAEFIDKWERGTLNHLVFECFLKALKERGLPLFARKNGKSPELTDEYESIFQASVQKAVEEENKELSFMAQTVLSVMTGSLLDEMRNTVADFSCRFSGYTVYSVEEPLSVETESFIAEGRIDAVLVSPESCEAVIVDFKTSTVPGNLYYDEEAFALTQEYPDFQMPMYFYLLKNQARPVTATRACYYAINGQKLTLVCGEGDGAEIKPGKYTQSLEDYRKTEEKFTECLEFFASAIKEKKFSVGNKDISWQNCNSCDYRAVCRKVFNVGKAF